MGHPYGTINRNGGLDHIITKKGINRASADTGFMLIAYNLRRILNILGVVKFTELLSKLDNSINKLFRFIGSIISAIIDSRLHYNGNPSTNTINLQ